MSINLSDLTSPNNQDVLAEITSGADFLDPIGKLENLSRGSNAGGHALQTTALLQPKALPLDANGKGYCYLPATNGNAPAVTFPTIGGSDDFVLEMDVYLVSGTNLHFVSGANGDHRLAIYNGSFYIGGFNVSLSSPLALGVSNIKIERTSGTITLKQNDAVIASRASSSALTFTHLSFNGQFGTSVVHLNGYIQKTTLSIGGTEQLNIDFTATNVRHGDTKFKCATGQVVTINQSGNDPATIIKKSVLRFDGANSGLKGLFNQTITDGAYMFAAFSVLGDGGEPYTRVFQTINAANNTPVLFSSRYDSENSLYWYSSNNTWQKAHDGMYDDERGDILHELLFTSGLQKSRVNNADAYSATLSESNTEMFSYGIANNHPSDSLSAAIDLEFLALFPATITDAQADSVRSYINNRNNVFSLVDNGYYFFDPQKADFTGNFTAANTLDGYITGSDNGDTDVRSNLTLEQSTLNDQPSTDGYTITFNDSAEHLEFENSASQNLSGWQVVGTSLGTFAYRVDNDAVTELNLLGNLGNSFTRKLGDLYGIILLPDSASSADIESARRLLIDRGASDGAATGDFSSAWRQREDIVEFNTVNMSAVTNAYQGWYLCNAISEFRITDISNSTNFTSAWQGCSALTSFPAGAKLGTEATGNVNFTSAWQSSGLTSFSTPLPSATNVSQGWYQCASLTSFSSDLSAATTANYAWLGCTSLTSFDTPLPSATQMFLAWYNCSSLTSFSSELPLAANANQAWLNCTSLTDFSVDVFANWNPSSITSGVFNLAWDGCTSLTAQSVENILTAIDASGKYATSDGDPYQNTVNTQLADAGIDIDYDGTTPSAATDSAITSLRGKGWVIFINGVERIP
jgi:hypothetical protein